VCVIHMILSKKCMNLHALPKKGPSGSSKWDFAIFPQRNWENFGIYFSSVNSTKFAIFWFTFIQKFWYQKNEKKTLLHSGSFFTLDLGDNWKRENKPHSHWVRVHILLIDCANDNPWWWNGAFLIHKVQTLKY